MLSATDYKKKIAYILRNNKQLIYLTAALVALGGLVRLFSYKWSVHLLNISFLPYLIMRGGYYITRRNMPWTTLDKQRFAILLALSVLILLNSFTMFKAEFLMFFLLMVDYILVINKRPNQVPNQYKDA